MPGTTSEPPVTATPAARQFADRHIGPRPDDVATMLERIGAPSLAALVDQAVPAAIRSARPLALPDARGEAEVLADLRALAARNRPVTSMIGLGYHGTRTPAVIRRNVLENPGWYTSYTPYQPEISQGRLEAMLVFQTMVADLTALPIAGASLLDEATAVTEAVLLMRRAVKGREDGVVVVDAECLPQTLAVVTGRADAVGLPLVVADLTDGLPADLPDVVGLVVAQPGASGVVRDVRALIEAAHERGALVTVAADLLSLTMLTSPGELGADVAVGSAQRFGVPLFYGGPHAAYVSVRSGLERALPGRLVGVSVDADGATAYRLALQTREQHIRREKATSNICTAQALLAVVAAMYGAYHGPEGLRAIATQVHSRAVALADGLRAAGIDVVHEHFFDTVLARVPGRADAVLAAALDAGINLRRVDADHVGIACDETTTPTHVEAVLGAFAPAQGDPTSEATLAGGSSGRGSGHAPRSGAGGTSRPPGTPDPAEGDIPAALIRTSEYLTHPTFHRYRSETALMRYLRRLADKDLALDRTMIPLGSCTMKLNAAVEMEPISWPEFADIHPFAPADQAAGYAELIGQLEGWLAEITGYAAVSVQPNAGSQGELAGLLAIRGYHRSRGDERRRVCLIPASAHGTNAASAVLAGMRVVVVKTAADGTIDLEHLRVTLEEHAGEVAAIMITYPSTHGVYEGEVTEVCRLVHEGGGQVYIDGANLNALVGLARPGEFGGDVSHLNLHKTFCIPHGGGGPGVGPVAVAEHLVPFLPGRGSTPVSAAPFGSAGILPISWAYVALMGADGLRSATEHAVLAANYVAARLTEHFPVLYTGPGGRVAHECILDLRALTAATGVTAEDVAKRLIDYGFHAPTLSFPVTGTLMVEPTESEDLAELDRFCEAMIAIRGEIQRVADGEWTAAESPLRGAPHTAASVAADTWKKAYSRETAAFPLASLRADKYWPPVRRIDNAAGDRNLVCACPPIEGDPTFGRDVTPRVADPDQTSVVGAGAGAVASPLHAEHFALGATLTPYAGWLMPLRYTSDLAEHHAVRTSAGLFDLSHMGEIRISGPAAGAALDGALVGWLSALAIGRARYTMICADDGGVVDDLVVYRPADQEFLVVANAANAPVVLAELRARCTGEGVTVTDESADTALIAVQGPAAEGIVAAVVGGADERAAVVGLRYYASVAAQVAGVPAMVARTGYTGEDGFELFVPAERAPEVWHAVVAAGGEALVPAGLACRDSLRLEAGMPLYGNELDRTTTPYDAGLGRVVRLDKTVPDAGPVPFVGRTALAARAAGPAARTLVGLHGLGRRAARHGYPVLRGDAVVGQVTSGAPSPTLGHPIAMAYVTPEVSAEGTELTVDVRGRTEPVRVVPLPFYRRTSRPQHRSTDPKETS